MRKYMVPMVCISPYNSQVNGKIERTQRMYLEAIWKVVQGDRVYGHTEFTEALAAK